VRSFSSHTVACDALQLLMDERRQPGERCFVACSPLQEKAGDAARRSRNREILYLISRDGSFRTPYAPLQTEVPMSDLSSGSIRVLSLGCCVLLTALTQAASANRQAGASPTASSQMSAEAGSRNVVVDWNVIAQNAIVTVGAQPIQRSQLWITLVHVAMYDAVMSINGGYEPFKVTPTRLRPASREAAAVAAAHGVLVRLLPNQQASLDAEREHSLAMIPDEGRKENGIAIGEEVATILLQIHDGMIPVVSHTPGIGAGIWQPTPPAFANALLPGFADVTPLALVNASQFRPGPPPPLTSYEWAADYNEVKTYGGATGSLRTADQTETGLFYTEHAVSQYSRAFRRYAAENRLSLRQAVRFFAMANTAILDSQIACWDAKFYYKFWRPVTAIRGGSTDGNAATEPDPAWIGLAVTPPHPEYPAAHGCWTSATARILEHFTGTKRIRFVLDSAVTGTTHFFKSADDLRTEIINARVYGGMHYRNSVEVGATIGEQVADWVAANYFRCVVDKENDDQPWPWYAAWHRRWRDDCGPSVRR
jgi:hypothetical protein